MLRLDDKGINVRLHLRAAVGARIVWEPCQEANGAAEKPDFAQQTSDAEVRRNYTERLKLLRMGASGHG